MVLVRKSDQVQTVKTPVAEKVKSGPLPKEAELKELVAKALKDLGQGTSFPQAAMEKTLGDWVYKTFSPLTPSRYDEAARTLNTIFPEQGKPKGAELSPQERALSAAVSATIWNMGAPLPRRPGEVDEQGANMALETILDKVDADAIRAGDNLKTSLAHWAKQFEPLTHENYSVAYKLLQGAFPQSSGAQVSNEKKALINDAITSTLSALKQLPLPKGLVVGADGRLELEKDIVCPVLASLVKSGKLALNPEDGTISMEQFRKVLKDDLNSTTTLGGTLSLGGWMMANQPEDIARNVMGDRIDVVNLREGNVKHPADSAILTAGKFDQGKFDKLVAFAVDGKMDQHTFTRAIAAAVARDTDQGLSTSIDALTRGLNLSMLEFSGLLAVFGQGRPPTIKVSDLLAMYKDKVLPPVDRKNDGWVDNNGVAETMKLTAAMMLEISAPLAHELARSKLGTPSGLAAASARLSEGAEELTKAAEGLALSAGKAAACPYLAGGAVAPAQIAAMVKLHAK